MNPGESPQPRPTPGETLDLTAPRGENEEVDGENSPEHPDSQATNEPPSAAEVPRPDREIAWKSATQTYLNSIHEGFFTRVADAETWMPDADIQASKLNEIARQNPGRPEITANLQEVAKLLPNLMAICGDFRAKIFELRDRGDKFEHVVENGQKMLDALLMSVAEGHITSEDFVRLVSKVTVMPRAEFAAANSIDPNSYEGVSYCDSENGQIIFFEETLEDTFVTRNSKTKNLDLAHIITHEFSHTIVDDAVKYNPKIVELSKQLAGNTALVSLLPLHIQNALAEEKNPAKQAVEIMTDYTALYLASDGSFRAFFSNCIDKAVLDGKAQFIAALQLDEVAWDNAEAQGSAAKIALLESNPNMSSLIASYKELHKEIAKTLNESKGQLGIKDNEEEEYGLYSEGYQGFQQASPGGGQSQSSGRNEGSIWSTIGEMAKAFEADVNPVKETAGGLF